MDYSTEQEFKKIYRQLKCKANCSVLDNLTFNNGLTKTINNVQLGGEIIETTQVTMNSGFSDYPFQLSFLPDGLTNTTYPANKTVFLGLRADDAPVNDTLVGFWQTLTDSGSFFTGLGYTDNSQGVSERATIELAVTPGSSAVIELEVNNMALQLFPEQLVWASYGIPGGTYFDIDLGANLYRIGDINGIVNGTYIQINDATQLVTITNVPSYADDAAATGAGLTSGQLYKTTTAGSTFLKIVP